MTEIQEMHLPQPFCSHCKVAAKSLAAVDLPLPGGPVNNQAWEKPGITFPVKASLESWAAFCKALTLNS